MRYKEILEDCWTGYRQAGMKKKGDRRVPNCVPVAEVKIGPEMNANELLYKAAAMAMRDASREGINLDYEQAIRQASKIYGIPYQPSELPKLLAQRAEIDRQLAMLKQGKQVAKQRRQAKLAPTPAGAEEYWKTHALPTDRIKPATKTLEAIEEDLRKWFKEKWVRFGPDGKIRGSCARGSESEGKPKCLPQSKAHALGKKGRASAAAKKRREDPNPERRGPAKNVATKVKEATGDPRFDTMMGRIVDPVAALSQDRVYEEQLEDYVFAFMNEFLGRMDRLGIEVWLDNPRAGEDLTNPKFLQAYEQASVKAVQRFMQGKKLDVNNQRLVAKVKADFDENADQVNPVAGFLGAFMQGFTTLRPGEIDVLNKAGMLKKPGDVNENNWDDADEFDEDDRLRDGDYVRDSQDGEYGEVFRMSGDPSERRVRILDRDGRGWYISPERLVAVDRDDPAIQKYFGKKRHRDMDEADVAEDLGDSPVAGAITRRILKQRLDLLKQYGPKLVGAAVDNVAEYVGDVDEIGSSDVSAWVAQVERMLNDNPPEAFAESLNPGEYHIHTVYFKDGTKKRIRVTSDEFDVVGYYTKRGQAVDHVDYDFQIHSNMTEQTLDEKQDACYHKVRSRYKVWPSAYASGALVQCRKKGAANWGTGGKKKK
jgi:hypothetical protein